MVICNRLPNKIGTLLLENPKGLKKEDSDDDDDEDNVKLGDICIENAILVKPKKNEKAGLKKTKTKI